MRGMLLCTLLLVLSTSAPVCNRNHSSSQHPLMTLPASWEALGGLVFSSEEFLLMDSLSGCVAHADE